MRGENVCWFWIQRNGSAVGCSVTTGGITTLNPTWALRTSFSLFYFFSTQSFSLSPILFFLIRWRKTLMVRPQNPDSHSGSSGQTQQAWKLFWLLHFLLCMNGKLSMIMKHVGSCQKMVCICTMKTVWVALCACVCLQWHKHRGAHLDLSELIWCNGSTDKMGHPKQHCPHLWWTQSVVNILCEF